MQKLLLPLFVLLLLLGCKPGTDAGPKSGPAPKAGAMRYALAVRDLKKEGAKTSPLEEKFLTGIILELKKQGGLELVQSPADADYLLSVSVKKADKLSAVLGREHLLESVTYVNYAGKNGWSAPQLVTGDDGAIKEECSRIVIQFVQFLSDQKK
ncbi:hypothetical protein GMSM_24540 [Geomonas sp. Red276]